MQPTDAVWFKSKIDWWMGLVLAFAPVMMVVALVTSVTADDGEGVVAGLVGLVVVAGIYLLLVVPVRYGITDDTLLVHFGVVRQRIALASITEVRPTHSPLSSPALSLDRLAIKTGRGPMKLTLISPLEREEFLGILSVRANLVWDGERWTRTGGAPTG